MGKSLAVDGVILSKSFKGKGNENGDERNDDVGLLIVCCELILSACVCGRHGKFHKDKPVSGALAGGPSTPVECAVLNPPGALIIC